MTGKVTSMPAISKYKDSFKDIVIKMGSEGKSFIQMATALGVNRRTIHNWSKNNEKYPGFGEALETARNLSQCFWEEIGYKGVTGQIKGFNHISWIYTMKCRFNEDWSEVKKSQVDINNNYTLLTDDEINAKLENYKSKMLEVDKDDDRDEISSNNN